MPKASGLWQYCNFMHTYIKGQYRPLKSLDTRPSASSMSEASLELLQHGAV